MQMKRTIQTKQLHTDETKTHQPSKTAQVVQSYTPLHFNCPDKIDMGKTPTYTINHVYRHTTRKPTQKGK